MSRSEALPIDAQWRAFAHVSGELVGIGEDDELFGVFLSVWAGLNAEEQFLDTYELQDAIEESNLPEAFRQLAASADRGYTGYDAEPPYAGMYSSEWGWALAYPDRVLRFGSPLDLLDHLAARASAKA